MESAVIAAIALLALGGGTIALLARQGMLPSGLPALRSSSVAVVAAAGKRPKPVNDGNPGAEITPGPSLVSSVDSLHAAPTARLAERLPAQPPPERLRFDLMAARDDAILTRLDQIEERLEELQRAVTRQVAGAEVVASRTLAELAARRDAQDSRYEAALERLRAETLAIVARVTTERQPGTSDLRPDVCAELYARTARLETALAAVTNPVLLPGEPYAPPTEFLPEALIWENWNEVGERAFALAEHLSAQRLHLSGATRDEMTGFVTSLRTLLTRSVYPNLLPEPDQTQQETLRAALEEIAAELPRMRDLLEREYRAEGSG